jgi:aryl-alcohol dehydrogenase-like predicted oxidoreductase
MRKIRFGRTGVEVPAVSLGTWGYSGANMAGDSPVGWTGHDDAKAKEALAAAYDREITHWDTADVYGNGRAEGLIGEMWPVVPRDAIFLATKVGWDSGPYPHAYHPQLIRERFSRSLELLQTDHVDLYYMHHCDFGDGDRHLDEALEVFHALREEGKVRFIGLSDWNSSNIMRVIERVDPDVVQPYRNVMDDDYTSSGLRAWVEDHDLGVAFFSPIKHGLLLGKYERPVTFPEGDFRQRVDGFGDATVIERMKEARHALEARWPDHSQPVLHGVIGAILSDSPSACALLGQRNAGQAEAAAAVGEPLSTEDAAWVRSLFEARTL